MKRILIAGASGMVGNIVLNHCLRSAEIQEVVSIVRKKQANPHPKLKEIIHSDFGDFSSIEKCFKNIDVAYYCLGVYTGAVPDDAFRRITVDCTVAFAAVLKKQSPGAVLCFLSGSGADPKEKSRISFARYKGMAENHLRRLFAGQLYIFRPGYIYPVEKRKEPNLSYRILRMFYPLVRLLGSGFSVTSDELGRAMFQTGLQGAGKMILENRDIIRLIRK